MEKDMFIALYGQDLYEKDVQFTNGLDAIQGKYIDWFKEQVSKLADRPHAYINEYAGLEYRTRIVSDTQLLLYGKLPEHIQDEIILLFQSIYR